MSKFLSLLDDGWDVHVVCGSSNPEEWRRFPELMRRPELRSRVHVLWPSGPQWLAGLLLPFSLAWCAFRATRSLLKYFRRGIRRFGPGILRRFYLDAELIALEPDLVHFEFGSIARGRMRLKELIHCKLLVSFRGYDLTFLGLEDPDYYAEVWDRADGLHLLGSALWLEAQRRGCPADKFHALIPPAIDLSFFDPGDRKHTGAAGGADRPLKILSVGRLEWIKGYEYGLAAVKLLRDRGVNCEYGIIGAGAYLEAVAFARHQMGLDDIVHLWGSQPQSEVRDRMLWADVLLHSATAEGFCNTVVEAQAMSLPVVCTDAHGLPENVADGETGFVVPRRNPAALAEKIEQLAQDPDLRQRMGTAGRRRALAEFQLKDQAQAFGRLYSTLLGKGEGNPGAS